MEEEKHSRGTFTHFTLSIRFSSSSRDFDWNLTYGRMIILSSFEVVLIKCDLTVRVHSRNHNHLEDIFKELSKSKNLSQQFQNFKTFIFLIFHFLSTFHGNKIS